MILNQYNLINRRTCYNRIKSSTNTFSNMWFNFAIVFFILSGVLSLNISTTEPTTVIDLTTILTTNIKTDTTELTPDTTLDPNSNLSLESVTDTIQTRDFAKTLKYLHVIFRHGDRTPDVYCKNMEGNHTEGYWPDGYGALTKIGKNQEYAIGVSLRERFGDWLGDMYYPEIVEARSTDTPRTKMSLALCLAGLFPPSVDQLWNWEVNWQPIPYTFEKRGNDMLLQYPTACPKYMDLYQKTLNSSEVQSIIKAKQRIINYVLKNVELVAVGDPVNRPVEYMFSCYFCLYAMEQMGRPLPAWSRAVYPEALQKLAILEYQLKTYNDELKQYTGGQLLKKFIDDATAIIEGTMSEGRKITLYSGHEYNVAHLLRAFNSFAPQIPAYGSYILVELHKIKSTYGFKIFYQNYIREDPIPIRIPGCNYFCPMSDFVRILQDYLPGPDTTCY